MMIVGCVCGCFSLSLLHLDSMPGSMSLAVLSVWTLIPDNGEGSSLSAIGSRLLGVSRMLRTRKPEAGSIGLGMDCTFHHRMGEAHDELVRESRPLGTLQLMMGLRAVL
jgi:hypothetical protein